MQHGDLRTLPPAALGERVALEIASSSAAAAATRDDAMRWRPIDREGFVSLYLMDLRVAKTNIYFVPWFITCLRVV